MGFQEDADVKIGPDRDRWGRPLLVPAEGGDRQWYSRASGLSEYGSGLRMGLETWKKRNVAIGIARRPDVAAMLAALPPMDTGDKKGDAVVKAQVDEYIEAAMVASEADAKANYGTTFHELTTQRGAGQRQYAPDEMKADLRAYDERLALLGIEPLMDEVFVACDHLRASGTFDHLYRLPDGRIVVGDKKTGQRRPDLIDVAIQLAVYANSDVYDYGTDERESLELIAESLGGHFDSTAGLLVHSPFGQGCCEILELDLVEGYSQAMRCADMRDARLSATRPDLVIADMEVMTLRSIEAAASKERIREIMGQVSDPSDAIRSEANSRWSALD